MFTEQEMKERYCPMLLGRKGKHKEYVTCLGSKCMAYEYCQDEPRFIDNETKVIPTYRCGMINYG